MKKEYKPLAWLALCLLPLFLGINFSFGERLGLSLMLFVINPVYMAGVSYYFINKANAIFMYFVLLLPNLIWFYPYLTRNNDAWLPVAELQSMAGFYQIIGITICFAVACVIKYRICRTTKEEVASAELPGEICTKGTQAEKKVMKYIRFGILCLLPALLVGVLILLLKENAIAVLAYILLLNPVYLASVSYEVITKKNWTLIGAILILPQFAWFLPYTRLVTEERFSGITLADIIRIICLYQIIGMAISFAIACLAKYIVYRHKAKKAEGEASLSD